MTPAAARAFIRDHALRASPPLAPELTLWLAGESTPLWQATETVLATRDLPPPFWAFAWPGGQALARFVLDRPETVRGRRVLDFGAGGGLVGLATLKAGAESALAVDLDPMAAEAAAMNAEANALPLEVMSGDATALDPAAFDVVLAGDVSYDRREAAAARAWLHAAAEAGACVYLGDPGRAYLPQGLAPPLARYEVPTSRDLERETVTSASVWRIGPASANSD